MRRQTQTKRLKRRETEAALRSLLRALTETKEEEREEVQAQKFQRSALKAKVIKERRRSTT